MLSWEFIRGHSIPTPTRRKSNRSTKRPLTSIPCPNFVIEVYVERKVNKKLKVKTRERGEVDGPSGEKRGIRTKRKRIKKRRRNGQKIQEFMILETNKIRPKLHL